MILSKLQQGIMIVSKEGLELKYTNESLENYLGQGQLQSWASAVNYNLFFRNESDNLLQTFSNFEREDPLNPSMFSVGFIVQQSFLTADTNRMKIFKEGCPMQIAFVHWTR